MKRSMLQVYVCGSNAAVALYRQAFDAPLLVGYQHENGTYHHAELDVHGQVLAVSEAEPIGQDGPEPRVTGNTMQFCLHFGEGQETAVRQAYAALAEGGTVMFPLGVCPFSPLMADVVDRFGVRWCIFV